MATPMFLASLEAGRALFEQGEYRGAHEAWESGWRQTRDDERLVLQVLVLWATALFQQGRGKAQGAHRLLLRALERLSEVRRGFDAVELDALGDGLVGSLERCGEAWSDALRPPFPARTATVAQAELEQRTRCPYCGELVLVSVAPEEAPGARYVEDCPVCCRPWHVTVGREGGAELSREDG